MKGPENVQKKCYVTLSSTAEKNLNRKPKTIFCLVLSPIKVLEKLIEIFEPRNTKVGSNSVPLTSCLTSLESAVLQLTIFVLFEKQTNPNQSNRRSTVQ